MLTREERELIFANAKAIIPDDHFVYAKKETGWFHGSAYVNKDAIYPFANYVNMLCGDFAEHFRDYGIDAVVVPTIGGVSIAQWTSF